MFILARADRYGVGVGASHLNPEKVVAAKVFAARRSRPNQIVIERAAGTFRLVVQELIFSAQSSSDALAEIARLCPRDGTATVHALAKVPAAATNAVVAAHNVTEQPQLGACRGRARYIGRKLRWDRRWDQRGQRRRDRARNESR